MPETTRRTFIAAGPLGLAALSVTSAYPVHAQSTAQMDGFTVMASDPRFRTWVSLVQAAGLTSSARGATPYTVFAPTEAAFSRYPTLRQDLLPNASQSFPDTSNLIRLVRAHVMYGLHPVSEFQGRRVTVRSVAGTPITVDGTGSGPVLVSWSTPSRGEATARLTQAPIQASNALIYALDDVILGS